MYNSPYENYMRNSLGYNQMPMMNMNQMNWMNPMSSMNEMYETEGNFMCNQTSVDDMYPEIYRIIYPMVCKACMNVQENVTEDLVSRITNEVYINVEHMEVAGECRSSQPSSNVQSDKSVKNNSLNNRVVADASNNVRQETRQTNPLLRDLIRILVLRELLGHPRRPRPPFRPPFGGGIGPGMRPPFGGGPGMMRQESPYMF